MEKVNPFLSLERRQDGRQTGRGGRHTSLCLPLRAARDNDNGIERERLGTIFWLSQCFGDDFSTEANQSVVYPHVFSEVVAKLRSRHTTQQIPFQVRLSLVRISLSKLLVSAACTYQDTFHRSKKEDLRRISLSISIAFGRAIFIKES